MDRSRRTIFVPPPRSETGTTFTDASSLPEDPEFRNAGIWNQPKRPPTDKELFAESEAKNLEVDNWVKNLCHERSAISRAIQEGIRTTDITRQYYQEAASSSEAQTPNNLIETDDEKPPKILTFEQVRRDRLQNQGQPFPAPGRKVPEAQTARRGQRQGRAPQTKQQEPPRPQNLGPGQLEVSGRNAGQQRNLTREQQRAKFEGPTHDTRKLNAGDLLFRDDPDHAVDWYLLPTRASEKQSGKNEKVISVESRFVGFERHHIHAIAEFTGTLIKFPYDIPEDWSKDKDGKIIGLLNRIRIWGEPEGVQKAKVFLMYLNKHADKDVQSISRKTLGWAKVKALPDQRHRDAMTKEEKEKEDKKRFRIHPKDGEVFPYSGAFAWPQAEVNPSDVLGMNYESLDPIRHEHEVYIMYSAKRQCFRVQGYDNESIQEALDRIYCVFCEIAARNRNQISHTLFTPPDIYYPQVAMDPDHGLDDQMSRNMGVEPRFADDGILPRKENWAARKKTLELANECYIKNALDSCLKDLNYLRMYAKLRVYFGSLLLFGYKRPRMTKHTVEEFTEMMNAKLARGDLVRHIGNAAAGQRLRDFCDAFCHPSAGTEDRGPVLCRANSVDRDGNMEADYSTSMHIMVTRKPEGTFELKLEVDFDKTPNGQYRVAARRWLRVPRTDMPSSSSALDGTKKRMPLDLKVANLNKGVAYQIDMTLGQPYTELDNMPILTEFVLHLELVDAEDGKSKRVSYINLPGIKVTSIITKTRFPYYFVGSHYIFEVTRYEHIGGTGLKLKKKTNEAMIGGFPADYTQQSTTDVLWGASLYNKEWDAAFANQVELPIGRHADWQPGVEAFLGDTGRKIFEHGSQMGDRDSKIGEKKDGFAELMAKIEFGVKAFHEVKKMVFGDRATRFVEVDVKGKKAIPQYQKQQQQEQQSQRPQTAQQPQQQKQENQRPQQQTQRPGQPQKPQQQPKLQKPVQHTNPQPAAKKPPIDLLSGDDYANETDETDTTEEDVYGKSLSAGQRLAAKLGRVALDDDDDLLGDSVYGDSEWSEAVKQQEEKRSAGSSKQGTEHEEGEEGGVAGEFKPVYRRYQDEESLI